MRLAHILRRRWEAFAERTGLRLLPPVGAAVAVLAAGVLLPFLPRVDATPPQLAPSLASSRIARFLRMHEKIPDAGPTGAVYAARPAFFWPARDGAESSAFRLLVAAGAGMPQLPRQVSARRPAMWRRGGGGALRRELLIVQTTVAVLLLTAAGVIYLGL